MKGTVKRGVAILFAIVIAGFLAEIMYLPHQPTPATFRQHAFSGNVRVSITENLTGSDRSLQYDVNLDEGRIVSIAPQPDKQAAAVGAHVDVCFPEAVVVESPNGQYAGSCKASHGPWVRDSAADVLLITDKTGGRVVQSYSVPSGFSVRGLAWSPNSSALAVLLNAERLKITNIGVLAALTGHPVPLEDFKMVFISIEGSQQLETPLIRKNSPYGWAKIEWLSASK